LKRYGVVFAPPERRFDEEVLSFEDPDGLSLELVGVSGEVSRKSSAQGPISAEHALTGFHHVSLTESQWEATSSFLTDTMGFHITASHGDGIRYSASGAAKAALIDVERGPGAARGIVSVGTVHHIAWRVSDDESQRLWRYTLVDGGIDVTSIIDRRYFRSIYFHEPGGVLFEIATDPPGFSVDESPEELGTHLMLPPWLEGNRKAIEQRLPRVVLPVTNRAA
jgi:catechol 2,3-dioxygenase-like lactoylglutathione lyase family enzyme